MRVGGKASNGGLDGKFWDGGESFARTIGAGGHWPSSPEKPLVVSLSATEIGCASWLAYGNCASSGEALPTRASR